MGEVVKLSQFQSKNTIALLRALMIATTNGDVIGVEVKVRFRNGREKLSATGIFDLHQLVHDGTDDSSY